MPTSNGQVGRYDIRREAVHTDHIVDEAVATAKIPDLAVTFPDKLDDPFWNYAEYLLLFHNATVTSTFATYGADLSFDVPAWVDQVTVNAQGNFQVSNSSGATRSAQARVEIEEESEGAYSISVANNETGIVPIHRSSSLTGVAGSTLTVSMEVRVDSGTNTTNFGTLQVVVIGTR